MLRPVSRTGEVRTAVVVFLAVALSGCPKANEGAASSSSAAPAPASASPATAPTKLAPGSTECQALRDELAQAATAARRCTSGATGQCAKCVPGHIHHCGIFVGDAASEATRDYLAQLKLVSDRGCMLPTTATPSCDPATQGSCGADGQCDPLWCNPPRP